MANCHESFIVFLPFLILFVIYYGYKEESVTKFSLVSLWQMVKKRLAFLIALCLIFASLMVYIVFFLGVNNYGAVDVGYPISKAIVNWTGSLIEGDLRYYWWFGIILVVLMATFYDKIKTLWMKMILFASIILPQFILYEKEGVYERYLLPLTIGWALFFVVMMYGLSILNGKRKVIYSVVLFIMAFLLARTVVVEADYYRFRGQSVTAMLNESLEIQNEGFNVASSLGISNPEADLTIQFWSLSHGHKETWYWNEPSKEIKELPMRRGDESINSSGHDLAEVDLFIAYNRDDRHFTIEPTVELLSMHHVKCGSLDLYYSDRAYSELSEERLSSLKIKPTIYGIGME